MTYLISLTAAILFYTEYMESFFSTIIKNLIICLLLYLWDNFLFAIFVEHLLIGIIFPTNSSIVIILSTSAYDC